MHTITQTNIKIPAIIIAPTPLIKQITPAIYLSLILRCKIKKALRAGRAKIF